jgi:hypothetical protein
VSVSISCAVIRTRPPALRTEPSSTYRTPNSRPTRFTSIAVGLCGFILVWRDLIKVQAGGCEGLAARQ